MIVVVVVSQSFLINLFTTIQHTYTFKYSFNALNLDALMLVWLMNTQSNSILPKTTKKKIKSKIMSKLKHYYQNQTKKKQKKSIRYYVDSHNKQSVRKCVNRMSIQLKKC